MVLNECVASQCFVATLFVLSEFRAAGYFEWKACPTRGMGPLGIIPELFRMESDSESRSHPSLVLDLLGSSQGSFVDPTQASSYKSIFCFVAAELLLPSVSSQRSRSHSTGDLPALP